MYAYGELVQRAINIDQKLNNNKPNSNWTHSIDLNRLNLETAESKKQELVEKDKETLYQFALAQIDIKQYKFAYDALKRIRGYKDSEQLIEKIENL